MIRSAHAPPPPAAQPPAQPPPPPLPPYPPAQYPPYPQHGGVGALPVASHAHTHALGAGPQPMRYALPPHHAILNQRPLPVGRNGKEVKKRTKTGCLTCRKRRIKCDEGHPTCRNCQKSKRDCLGYDPIFKQQPGPANIQPAPVSHHLHPSPDAPPGLSSSQLHQHHSFPSTGGTFVSAQSVSHEDVQPPTGGYGTSSLDPILSIGDHTLHMAQNKYPASLQPQRRVKIVSMEQLFSLNDVPPQYIIREVPPSMSPATLQELDPFYLHHYATGLDDLFETTWYTTRGLEHLHRDAMLQDFVAQCAEQWRLKNGENAHTRPSLEARLVWTLATMPRAAGADPAAQELVSRVAVAECLLTGDYLAHELVPLPDQQAPASHALPPDASPAVRKRLTRRAYWHQLGRIVSLRDDDAAVLPQVTAAFAGVRALLHQHESRDVLYSLAVARHVGGRLPDFRPDRHLVASSNAPDDDLNRLQVAQHFVEGEELRGSTQIVHRLCSMALRSWLLQSL